MEAIVRSSKMDDLERVIPLWKRFMDDLASLDRPIPTHEENTRRQKEFFGKLVSEDPGQIQVAEADGKLVGFVACQKSVKFPLDMGYTWAYISDVFVDEAYRGRGLGKMLLESVLRHLKSEGVRDVRLAVWHKNEIAKRLYKELGFAEYMETLRFTL